MRRLQGILALSLLLAFPTPKLAFGQQTESYDYWRFQRDMVHYGQQAVLQCNGLFTSNRTLEQVFDQELAFLPQPVGTPRGGPLCQDSCRLFSTVA